MVFIDGPYQVGKTVLSKNICKNFNNSLYINLDSGQDRKIILNREWSNDNELVTLDELCKYPRWKRWIKGIYDTKRGNQQYLITGSACLDVYQRGGDSLMGRYKPAKVYFYNNSDCKKDEGTRLENLVATHLLKRLHFREDYFGERCSLHYIRDRDSREVDFVTVIDGKVNELIEVKLSDCSVSSSLKYYQKLLNPKHAVQIVGNLTRTYDQGDIRITNPIDFFKDPPWNN